MKTHYTKEELKRIFSANMSQESKQIEQCLVAFIETKLLDWHLNNIKERQNKIKKLWSDKHGFLSIWNGSADDLTPGCYACLFEKINHVRHSSKCNRNCEFCYYYGIEIDPIPKGLYRISGFDFLLTLEEIKLIFSRQGKGTTAVGWLQREPLLEMDKIPPLMEYLASEGFHQYLYTNGTLATKGNLQILRNCGLNEIRFNLQATDFDESVLINMAHARNYINYLCIETPMFSKTFENFKKHKQQILDTGLNQINVPELQLRQENVNHFRSEGPIYKHRKGYISPISSRHYTYDLIEIAEAENWNVVINDCSNDTKFFRGVVSYSEVLGFIQYFDTMIFPVLDYLWAIDNILDEEVYEIF